MMNSVIVALFGVVVAVSGYQGMFKAEQKSQVGELLPGTDLMGLFGEHLQKEMDVVPGCSKNEVRESLMGKKNDVNYGPGCDQCCSYGRQYAGRVGSGCPYFACRSYFQQWHQSKGKDISGNPRLCGFHFLDCCMN